MNQKMRTLRVAVICGVFTCMGLILANVAHSNSSPSELIDVEYTQVQTNEKRVEEQFKNIKVLRGLPASQMFSVMNFMRASLGVSCAYCHVHSGGDNWQFESDEKPTKLMARRMIQMVLDNNRTNGELFVNTRLTCFTCHRGNSKPVSLPSLPVTAPEGGASGLPPSVKVSLPAAAELIDKYVAAVGGRSALAKMSSREMTGNLVTWDGSEVAIVIRVQLPDKIKVTIGSANRQRTQSLDGNAGWAGAGTQTRALAPAEMSRLRATTKALELLSLTAASADMKVTNKETIDGHEVFVAERPAGDGRTEKLYFDEQTGLLVRAITIVNTMLAPIPEQVDYADYRDVDGAKLPFSIRSSFVDPWIGVGRKFSQIVSVPQDDAAFAAPK